MVQIVKLKPCLHCDFPMNELKDGSEAKPSDFVVESDEGAQQVKCPNCGARGPDWLCDYMAPCRTDADAVRVWNGSASAGRTRQSR